jgi:hypothetical protein
MKLSNLMRTKSKSKRIKKNRPNEIEFLIFFQIFMIQLGLTVLNLRTSLALKFIESIMVYLGKLVRFVRTES